MYYHILAGLTAASVSLAVFIFTVNLNGTPDFLKDVNFVTITPSKSSLLKTGNIQVDSFLHISIKINNYIKT